MEKYGFINIILAYSKYIEACKGLWVDFLCPAIRSIIIKITFAISWVLCTKVGHTHAL